MQKLFILPFLLLTSHFSIGQVMDTLTIDATNIKTDQLTEGTHQYLVYFKFSENGNRKNYQFWTRTVSFERSDNRPVIKITQYWENNDTIFHTSSALCDRASFEPLYHENWWMKGKDIYTNAFDFIDKTAIAQNKTLKSDTSARAKGTLAAFRQAYQHYCLDWHLDLEVFSALPYKENRVFKINFYDPGFPVAPKYELYTVTGSARLKGYDRQEVDCWLLKHGDGPDDQEVFWINKKTHEVLKLDQQYHGMYRYKIKIPGTAL